jgi:hypothetical protein
VRGHAFQKALQRVIPATSTVLSRVFAVEGRGRDLFAAAERLALEGIVAKRKVDPYAPSTVWYKVKNADGRARRIVSPAQGMAEIRSRSRLPGWVAGEGAVGGRTRAGIDRGTSAPMSPKRPGH